MLSGEMSFQMRYAGIGGTNSYLGVHRVDEHLLAYKPDVVIVEFSVNDTDKTMNKYSYDSLVRKILSSASAALGSAAIVTASGVPAETLSVTL